MDTTLINIGEGILGEALVSNTIGAAEVVSEGEDTEVSRVIKMVLSLKVLRIKERSVFYL